MMNFKAVLDRKFSELEVLSLIRILSGTGLLLYYIFALLPHWNSFFGSTGFVRPEEFSYYPNSWIFWFWEYDSVKFGMFLGVILLSLFYITGIYAKVALIILLPIHLGYHVANPMIIHEPQPIMNLLLVLMAFLPLDAHWSIFKNKEIFPPVNDQWLRRILISLLVYIGLYYFFAGLKKIPDPNWISGRALELLANWPYLTKDNFLNHLLRIPLVSIILSYLTLLFEFCFIFLAFTRWRRFLILPGIIFHGGIFIALDVSSFFFPMIAWYPLLLLDCGRRQLS